MTNFHPAEARTSETSRASEYEPLIGLEPSVEQAGHQLVFNW